VHADAPGQPDPAIAAWTRDLLLRPHPTFRPELFTLVEEPASGRIASTLNLIPQTWSYGGVEVGVGRVELVGTHPDFRRRGLVRRQMELVHRWSAEAGHLMQGITGIPWYYRQFGYEMALELDGFRRVPVAGLAELSAGEAEPYRLRPATPDDIPFLAATDDHGRRRSLVWCVRDEAIWRYELDGRSEGNLSRRVLRVIETAVPEGEAARPVGWVAHAPVLWGQALGVSACELAPGISWLAVAPVLLRALRVIGEGYATDGSAAGGTPRPARFERVVLVLGTDHPLYRALPERARDVVPAYAWYVRVPDLPAFLLRVAPVFEARLADSPAAGHSGELKLNFYQGGLRLSFAAGRLVAAEPWPEPEYHQAGASFPPLTFLHLLFGRRSLAELERAFPDCRARTEEARVLLDALFPPRPSLVWPVA
ncbi:MAG: GNAT family N-acetyltransferase, partial [Chloroflexota bacterium]|nr:GNAT family N-acetyltransferase [Chloroflexota bacterium]